MEGVSKATTQGFVKLLSDGAGRVQTFIIRELKSNGGKHRMLLSVSSKHLPQQIPCTPS